MAENDDMGIACSTLKRKKCAEIFVTSKATSFPLPW